MRDLVDDQCARGAVNYETWFGAYDECRAAAARLVNALPEEIALVPNTSAGISTVARGLRLEAGDNVVIPEAEFPANVYPWTALHGIEVRDSNDVHILGNPSFQPTSLADTFHAGNTGIRLVNVASVVIDQANLIDPEGKSE